MPATRQKITFAEMRAGGVRVSCRAASKGAV
jgi:hypothetical protein